MSVTWWMQLSAISLFILAIDLLTPLGVADGILYVVVILFSLRQPKASPVAMAAAAVSLLILLGWEFSPPGDESWKVAANRILCLFAVWAVAVTGIYHHQAAENLRRAQEELIKQETLASLGKFAAILAHQIRNPLSSLAGAAQNIARGGLNEPDTRTLNAVVDEESRKLNTLLETFLEFTRLQGFKPEAEHLSQNIEDVLKSMLQNRAKLR